MRDKDKPSRSSATASAAFLAALLPAGRPCAGADGERQGPPVIPVELDCYRMWDQWSTRRIGARAYMRSTGFVA